MENMNNEIMTTEVNEMNAETNEVSNNNGVDGGTVALMSLAAYGLYHLGKKVVGKVAKEYRNIKDYTAYKKSLKEEATDVECEVVDSEVNDSEEKSDK